MNSKQKYECAVSRVLSRTIIYLVLGLLPGSSDTTRKVGGPLHPFPIWSCSGWGLPSRPVTRPLVRSYRTVSALPQKRRFVFCGTFLKVTLTGRYPASCPVELGLSSSAERLPRWFFCTHVFYLTIYHEVSSSIVQKAL